MYTKKATVAALILFTALCLESVTLAGSVWDHFPNSIAVRGVSVTHVPYLHLTKTQRRREAALAARVSDDLYAYVVAESDGINTYTYTLTVKTYVEGNDVPDIALRFYHSLRHDRNGVTFKPMKAGYISATRQNQGPGQTTFSVVINPGTVDYLNHVADDNRVYVLATEQGQKEHHCLAVLTVVHANDLPLSQPLHTFHRGRGSRHRHRHRL